MKVGYAVMVAVGLVLSSVFSFAAEEAVEPAQCGEMKGQKIGCKGCAKTAEKEAAACTVKEGEADKACKAGKKEKGSCRQGCGQGCVKPAEDAEGKKVEAPVGEGVVTGTAQTTCPIMGGAIDRKVFADHGGKRVYFCCAGCRGPFEKDPDKYLKKMGDAGVVLEETP